MFTLQNDVVTQHREMLLLFWYICHGNPSSVPNLNSKTTDLFDNTQNFVLEFQGLDILIANSSYY